MIVRIRSPRKAVETLTTSPGIPARPSIVAARSTSRSRARRRLRDIFSARNPLSSWLCLLKGPFLVENGIVAGDQATLTHSHGRSRITPADPAKLCALARPAARSTLRCGTSSTCCSGPELRGCGSLRQIACCGSGRRGSGVARGARHRQTGDGHCVAPPRFPGVLDLEESSAYRSTVRPAPRPIANLHHVGCEFPLGRPSDPR